MKLKWLISHLVAIFASRLISHQEKRWVIACPPWISPKPDARLFCSRSFSVIERYVLWLYVDSQPMFGCQDSDIYSKCPRLNFSKSVIQAMEEKNCPEFFTCKLGIWYLCWMPSTYVVIHFGIMSVLDWFDLVQAPGLDWEDSLMIASSGISLFLFLVFYLISTYLHLNWMIHHTCWQIVCLLVLAKAIRLTTSTSRRTPLGNFITEASYARGIQTKALYSILNLGFVGVLHQEFCPELPKWAHLPLQTDSFEW